ncbi:GerMN domain-containing protein, partial [Salmonella enterica]
DPTWTFLVPDVRWFPTLNASTRIAAALIKGQPSPRLANSVVSAFPETVSLGSPSVPVVNGVAQVDLKESALTSDQTTLSRMQAQIT